LPGDHELELDVLTRKVQQIANLEAPTELFRNLAVVRNLAFVFRYQAERYEGASISQYDMYRDDRIELSTCLLLEAKRKGQPCGKVFGTIGSDNLTIAIYDAALDAVASDADLDVRIRRSWYRVGSRKPLLRYSGTSKDWRTFASRVAAK